MIVSASYRTDIPAFYGGWFLERLRAGWCSVANPYSGRSHRVSLAREDVEGFVFWTRNARPFLPALRAVADRGTPFVVQFTITAYPRALEPSVVAPGRAIESLHELARHYGPATCVWRYDPVFLTSLTPPAWHRANFRRLAEALAGATDEVVLSFAQIYAKTRRNSDAAARRHGFSWWDPTPAEKADLLADLAATAVEAGLRPTLCAQPELLRAPLGAARCIDAARLARQGGRPVEAPTAGNRPGCLCARSRDIGVYDSCPHGCCFCYAVSSPARAKRTFRAHRPEQAELGARRKKAAAAE